MFVTDSNPPTGAKEVGMGAKPVASALNKRKGVNVGAAGISVDVLGGVGVYVRVGVGVFVGDKVEVDGKVGVLFCKGAGMMSSSTEQDCIKKKKKMISRYFRIVFSRKPDNLLYPPASTLKEANKTVDYFRPKTKSGLLRVVAQTLDRQNNTLERCLPRFF